MTIEVRDDEAAFILELLKNFSFVKLDEASKEKARVLESVSQGLKEAKMAERGEIKLQSAREWLNELWSYPHPGIQTGSLMVDQEVFLAQIWSREPIKNETVYLISMDEKSEVVSIPDQERIDRIDELEWSLYIECSFLQDVFLILTINSNTDEKGNHSHVQGTGSDRPL